MASAPNPNRTNAVDFDRFDVLQRIGGALGRVKRDRRMSLLDMAEKLGRSDDQLARYIAGEDMPVSLWMKALSLWPELADKFGESVAERAAQSRQVPLDLPETRP
jgi:transcriptional regulator with XRE-family HTH domain